MKTAVVICPGRGTYNASEIGALGRLGDASLIAGFDAIRKAAGQEGLMALDAGPFHASRHTTGDNASGLIYAASLSDFRAIKGVKVVAVTGNSMGWYTTLACAGALTPDDGFRVVNTMGTLMHQMGTGGQVIYPVTGEDWQPDPARRAQVTAWADGAGLALSIDLGGMLVLAGPDAALAAFVKSVPPEGRFPMRLPNHAAFHTPLMAPVAAAGQARLARGPFRQPDLPMIDGRGAIWWPGATRVDALYDYTLGHQVTEPYDLARAIRTAAREFAPDVFIIPGPGTTLGGSVAQSLIAAQWRGLQSKADFQTQQSTAPFVWSMGLPDQRALATGETS
ncbi:MAG: ACP S-malonyltransferase [Rhodobacteraceae bacterium]|jgi:acyl transferase domain-containing protein|nr:ACP S-malonyltransferase [Paracoccaceae bacterium]